MKTGNSWGLGGTGLAALSRKLVIVFVFITAAVIVLELGVIVSIAGPLKRFQTIHVRRYESCNMTRFVIYCDVSRVFYAKKKPNFIFKLI